MLIITGEWNAKVEKKESNVTGKSILGIINEAGDQLVDFCKARLVHHKHMLQTTEQMNVYTNFTRWPIQKANRLCNSKQTMEKLYSLSAKTKPGADCSSTEYELLLSNIIAQKKITVSKYNVNNIPGGFKAQITK